jgi:hypothetical protein
MQINSRDLIGAMKELSSFFYGSKNSRSDFAEFHSEDSSTFNFSEMQDLPRVVSSKGYGLHPILAEVLTYRPLFNVIASLDDDNSSISMQDIEELKTSSRLVADKMNSILLSPIIYKDNDKLGVKSNFIRTVDLSEIATYQLADVNKIYLEDNPYLLAIEKDLNTVGESRSMMFLRSVDSKSYNLLNLEPFGVANTGFSGIDLQETEEEYIVTILSNRFRTTDIKEAVDENGYRLPNMYSFLINGRDYNFTAPKARFIVRDVVLSEEKSGLPIKLLVELRQKDLVPIQVSSFYYLHRLHFPKAYFSSKENEEQVKSFTYLLDSGRSSTRQSEAMMKKFGSTARMNLEGISVVGDRAYFLNSDNDDGIPTYFYIDLKVKDNQNNSQNIVQTAHIKRIGDFSFLSDYLGIEKIVTYGMREKDGYIYSLHGRVGNYEDFFIVRVKEEVLRTDKMEIVQENLKIMNINLDGYTNRTIRPFGLFFLNDEIGIAIKDGTMRSAVLFFDGKNI